MPWERVSLTTVKLLQIIIKFEMRSSRKRKIYRMRGSQLYNTDSVGELELGIN